MLENVLGLQACGQSHKEFEEGRRRVVEALENTADELDVGGLQPTSIPESIVEPKQLRVLSLNNNHLTAFPAMLLKLSELSSLDLSLNDLSRSASTPCLSQGC